MIKTLRLTTVLVIALTLCAATKAQDLDNPGHYISAINNAQKEMNERYMAYVSAAAHSRKARKIEKLRKQALESINTSRSNTASLPYYKGDKSLRQSSIDYIKMCYNVFNVDYEKIVNMEDIAEQSFDEMQAYLLLQEKTSEKLNEANTNMSNAVKEFAGRYNVQLIESNSELSNILNESGELSHYVNKIYLTFFKCNWQDGEVTKALNSGKLVEAEQGRNSLLRYADEGLAILDTIKSFKGDASLLNACKRSLQFYKRLAEKEIPKQTDFYLKQENFEKIKKSFEAKSERDRTKEDVKTFNASVKEVNDASKNFNIVIQNTNKDRTEAVNTWNEAERNFRDEHTPHYKK